MIEGPEPGLFQRAAKTHRKCPIKSGVLFEPALRPGQSPEIHNGLGIHAIFSLA
jgi:hypothetical protein